jgi:hypothetical protein
VFSYTVKDADGLVSNSTTLTITVTGTNDAPVADLNTGTPGLNNAATFTEVAGPDTGANAVSISVGGTITDVDSANLSNLKVSLSTGSAATGDQLRFGSTIINITAGGDSGQVSANGTFFSYAVSDDSGTRIITFTSLTGSGGSAASAVKASYEVLLDGLKYNNTSDTPLDASTRVFGVTVNDGATNSSTATFTVTLAAVADDTTGPTATISHQLSPSAQQSTFTVHATDASGISSVQLFDTVNNDAPILIYTFSAAELQAAVNGNYVHTFTDGTAPFALINNNTHQISARVFDNGGNETTATDPVTFNTNAGSGNSTKFSAPAGVAGEPINLGLTDPTGQHGEITLTISGSPSDWTLNGGTHNVDGSWTVVTNDVSSLTVTTSSTYGGALLLTVGETWTNADGSLGYATIRDNVEAYAQGSPIFAWSGDDTLTASSGNDLLVFSQPIGHDVVYRFDPMYDKIDLIGYAGFTTFADIQGHIANDAATNAVITLGDGQSITLQGIDASSLSAENFLFDQTPLMNNLGTMTISDGAMLPLSGIINNTGTIALDSTGNTTTLELIQDGVTLQGGGQVILSDNDGNVIAGTLPSVTLTNLDNTISGAGQLGAGEMTLVNQGTIIANGVNALIIDTGSNVVINAGTLESTGSGGLIVNSDIANTGLIWAYAGSITIMGEVSGSGGALINAGTLEFGAASSINVTFAGDVFGTLVLDNPHAYTGQIFGFAGTDLQHSDLIDLQGITFDAGTSWVYLDGVGSNTGGILSIYETANGVTSTIYSITFGDGDYITANFILASDGHGGTLVADPPAASSTPISDGEIAGAVQLDSDHAEDELNDTNIISATSGPDGTSSGAGEVGKGELGVSDFDSISAAATQATTIDTGSNFAFNFGAWASSSNGGLTVANAMVNSDLPSADAANLGIHGDVSVNGAAIIEVSGSGASEGASSAKVVFGSDADQTAQLGDSFHFNEAISGLHGDAPIDLLDVNSDRSGIASVETAQGSASALMALDGTHPPVPAADNFNIGTEHVNVILATLHYGLIV